MKKLVILPISTSVLSAPVLLRGFFISLAVLLGVTACETVPYDPGPVAQPDKPPVEVQPRPEGPLERNPDEYVTVPQGQTDDVIRVALLLPFSSKSSNIQTVSAAMSNAAQLAAFESGDERYLLIPKDTKGTPEGAALAAQEALREGAEVILGPLFSESVEAVATIARQVNVPVVAFSSDTNFAGNGVYLLSFPPEIEVARVTDYAIDEGYYRFGVIAPNTEYGSRVTNSFTEEVFIRGGTLVAKEQYVPKPDEMLQPAKRLAKYAARNFIPGSGALPPRSRTEYYSNQLPASGGVTLEPGATPIISNDPFANNQGSDGFVAVLMPEQGTLLRALAPLLPYYDVNVKQVKLLGVSAWNNPRLTREPALNGGWFAAPEPALSAGFKARYAKTFNEKPPRLASLAYDGALLTARLARNPRGDRFTHKNITDPNGYLGADGLFRLAPDGTVERGLAILELRASGIKVIDPAPRSFVDYDGY